MVILVSKEIQGFQMAFQGLHVQDHSINLKKILGNKFYTNIDIKICVAERKKTKIVKQQT